MYQNFATDVMNDLLDESAENLAWTSSQDAYDDSFESFEGDDDTVDAYEEDLDEAVYRVNYSPAGRGLFRVDTSIDIANDPVAIQAALQGNEHAPGIWVAGGPRNAVWAARQGGFPRHIPHEPHLRPPPVGVGQPHIHGINENQRSPHIFYGRPPEGDFVDFDVFESAMVDALEAEDTDEFFRRLVRGIGRVARGIGRGIGRIARVVAPIASAIPLPWTQAIGRVARVAGRLMADGADEFEAIDALVNLAEAEELMDAAAPAIASMALHGVMPQAARLPPTTRQQLLRATTQAASAIARRQGVPAVRALPAVVQTAQRVVQQQGQSPRALPSAIHRVGMRLSQNPQLLGRVLRSANPMLRQQICAACGRPHRQAAMR
jgi:hypothetical protein